MVERVDNGITRTSGVNTWRAGCGGSRTSGSEGGPEKPTRRKPSRALRSDPYTEHPTDEGKVYLGIVLDAWSRRVVGWSIADHVRSELVVDAVQMAVWRRQPPKGRCVAHSDHGSQYTSWAFGTRLRAAGLLGSMGSVGDAYDNGLAESFFHTLQLELLDEHRWTSRRELALAIFEWVECWYNPSRRHSSIQMLSPADYERAHTPAAAAA